MTILQQSPIIMAPEVSVVSRPVTGSKLDEKPARPAFMDVFERTRDNYGPAELEQEAHYLEALRAWEARMEKKGRKYTADGVRERRDAAYDALVSYLKATGAPDEILTLAEGVKDLNYIYLTDASRWKWLSRFSLVQLGGLMPRVFRAVKFVRTCLNAGKQQ